MARPVDARRRETLLEAAAAHLRESGDVNASLDDIAERAGSSRRMLIHYFGTKDTLIAEALDQCATEARSLVESLPELVGDTAPVDAVGLFWEWLTADGGRSMRLFFSAASYALADGDPVAIADDSYPAATTRDWVKTLDSIASSLPSGTSTLVLAAIRGLILDQMLTGDDDRITEAVTTLQQLLKD